MSKVESTALAICNWTSYLNETIGIYVIFLIHFSKLNLDNNFYDKFNRNSSRDLEEKIQTYKETHDLPITLSVCISVK
jgi:hypothetical protein